MITFYTFINEWVKIWKRKLKRFQNKLYKLSIFIWIIILKKYSKIEIKKKIKRKMIFKNKTKKLKKKNIYIYSQLNWYIIETKSLHKWIFEIYIYGNYANNFFLKKIVYVKAKNLIFFS